VLLVHQIFLSVILFAPTGVPLLEYQNGPPLRAQLAGLSMFATSFGNEASAAGA